MYINVGLLFFFFIENRFFGFIGLGIFIEYFGKDKVISLGNSFFFFLVLKIKIY